MSRVIRQNDDDPVSEACERASRLMLANAPIHEVLTCLVSAAERVSPSLPLDYLNAIDRLRPDASVGTCAAAAATGSVVVTPSFLADGKWAELRHLPLALGFAGAWSLPIKSINSGRVLGTFGTYYQDVREPTVREVAAVTVLAATAAFVLDGDKAD